MFRILIIVGFYLIVLTNLQACSSSSLWLVNSLAKLENYKVYDDIEYGPDSQHRLTIYSPEKAAELLPTIIFFYGGCWGECLTLKRESYVFVAQALSSQGFNVVIPDYRHYPEVGIVEIMADARSVVEWVSEHIHDYQGDADKLLLMGHSAGAHMAALLSFDERYLTPQSYQHIQGFIGLAGPYDFLPFTDEYQKKVFAPESNYANGQPINFVDGTEPPSLLLYGNEDTTVKPRNIKNFTDKIKAAGGQVTAIYYQDLNHTDLVSALSIPLRNQREVFSDIIKFAKRVSYGRE